MYTKKCNLLIDFVGVVLAAIGLAIPLLGTGSADVVGGADWPTYRYLLIHGWYHIPALLLSLGETAVLFGIYGLIFGKWLMRYSAPKMTLLSLSVSVVLAIGAGSGMIFVVIGAFGNAEQYPVAVPVSIFAGILSLVALVILLMNYIRFRRAQMCMKGILLDILLVVITFLPLFFVVNYFGDLVGMII